MSRKLNNEWHEVEPTRQMHFDWLPLGRNSRIPRFLNQS